MASELPWTLTITSELRLLALARAFVEAVCQLAGLDERATHAVVLATDEATNNAIRHAHHGHPEAPIHIHCFVRPTDIEIRVQDEGPHFNLDAVPPLDPGELRIGGRGLFLMRTLMDELTCESVGERGNVLRMVKRFPLPPNPETPVCRV